MPADPIKDYQDAEDLVHRLRAAAARLEGASEQAMKTLRDEFNCETLEEARKLLGRLRRDQERDRKALEAGLREFAEQFGDRLGGM